MAKKAAATRVVVRKRLTRPYRFVALFEAGSYESGVGPGRLDYAETVAATRPANSREVGQALRQLKLAGYENPKYLAKLARRKPRPNAE